MGASERARRSDLRKIADIAHQPEIQEMLLTAAQDYEDITKDIDWGAVEIRHPELLLLGSGCGSGSGNNSIADHS